MAPSIGKKLGYLSFVAKTIKVFEGLKMLTVAYFCKNPMY